MICTCCGYEIKGKKYSVESGKGIVCEKCWNNPDLFFPEKLKTDKHLYILSKIAAENRKKEDTLSVKVIKLEQKGALLFTGKMKVGDILDICEIDKFEEEELTGYQRERYQERTSELVDYLTNCSLAIMPAILASIREVKFQSKDSDLGILSIPRKKGAVWIIDGQHRIGGFGKIQQDFIFSNKIDPITYSDLMNYELPVVFVDSKHSASNIVPEASSVDNDFSSEDIERTVFFVVNKTQKGIHASLKDALLYRIDKSGIRGLPAIEKEKWRISGTKIGITMNKEPESPLKDKINISGKRDAGKPIQLNSFVSSLKVLYSEEEFLKLTEKEKFEFLKSFWMIIAKQFPEAFKKGKTGDYMLLKALGIYALHYLAKDVFNECIENKCDYKQSQNLEPMLSRLSSFDWHVNTSPLSALGGMKGVNRAYEILSQFVKGDEEFHEKSLQDYIK
jgi:DGQHR domain-containing protein